MTIGQKTITIIDNNKYRKIVFDHLAHQSKNIYNTSIFYIQIFNMYKYEIYYKLDLSLPIDELNKIVKNKFNEYIQFYCDNKDIIIKNNNIVRQYIFNYFKQYYICNSLYNNFRNEIYNHMSENLEHNNNKLLLDKIIDDNLRKFYLFQYNRLLNDKLNNKKYSMDNPFILENIENNDNKFKNYKIKKLKKMMSYQGIISNVIQQKCNTNRTIPSDMIRNIANKAFYAYSSYYSLLNKGIYAKIPKFLPKEGKYIFPFSERSFIVSNNKIRLTVGDYIGKDFIKNNNTNDYVKLYENTKGYHFYVDKKYLKKLNNEKITNIFKNKNYIIDGNYYIPKDNKNIINASHIYIHCPKKINDKKIKWIEINPFYEDGFKYKINIIYEENIIDKKIDNGNYRDYISIDLGIKNLMTIYDPTGRQHIIKGNRILSINNYYNYLLDNERKNLSKEKKHTSDKLRNLFIDRYNKIRSYFDDIAKWLLEKYNNKIKIIIGYNKGWKTKCNLGKTTRDFYEIPYFKLINIIRDKFSKVGISIEINQESYTSKVDCLALEEVKKQENYLGKRIKRGLFSSSLNKLINADLNGAINIMRKYLNKFNIAPLETITGLLLFNPITIII